MFRASSSSVLFHFMLLLGLVMAATTVGYNLHQQEQTLNTMYLCYLTSVVHFRFSLLQRFFFFHFSVLHIPSVCSSCSPGRPVVPLEEEKLCSM